VKKLREELDKRARTTESMKDRLEKVERALPAARRSRLKDGAEGDEEAAGEAATKGGYRAAQTRRLGARTRGGE
jgi:DNA gyrase/topoisomerase IV subunit A